MFCLLIGIFLSDLWRTSAIVPIIFIRKNGASVVDTYRKIYASYQNTLLI
jgi:hypothetical protein